MSITKQVTGREKLGIFIQGTLKIKLKDKRINDCLHGLNNVIRWSYKRILQNKS